MGRSDWPADMCRPGRVMFRRRAGGFLPSRTWQAPPPYAPRPGKITQPGRGQGCRERQGPQALPPPVGSVRRVAASSSHRPPRQRQARPSRIEGRQEALQDHMTCRTRRAPPPCLSQRGNTGAHVSAASRTENAGPLSSQGWSRCSSASPAATQPATSTRARRHTTPSYQVNDDQ